MDSLEPMTESSATNGVSSTTNGDASAHITDFSHFQDQSQFQSGNLDQNHSISAGVYQHKRLTALDEKSLSTGVSDEIALYDRQIRLWGVKAQERYGKLGS